MERKFVGCKNNNMVESGDWEVQVVHLQGIKLEMLFILGGFFESSCAETLQFLCFFPSIVDTVKNREVGKNG